MKQKHMSYAVKEKTSYTYGWQKIFNSVLVATVYLLGVTTKKFGNSLATVGGLGSGLVTVWTGFSMLGSADAGSTTVNLRPGVPINVSVDLTKLAGTSGIFNLTIKYPQQLANSGLKLYPKLIGNYQPGQTTEIFQLLASNVNKVTETFSNGVRLGNEKALTSDLFTDGTLKWKYQTISNPAASLFSSISSPAIASDGTVYVVGNNNNRDSTVTGSIYAINADSTLKWQYTLNNNVNFYSPVIGSDGTIYCATSNYYLYAISPSGELRWQYQLNGQMSGGGLGGASDVRVSPAIGADNTIYLTTWANPGVSYLYAIYPTGGLKWQQQISATEVLSSVAIANDGTIYIADQTTVHAINPDGSLKWQYSNSSYYYGTSLPMAIGNNQTIYVICFNGESSSVLAMNPSGKLSWQFLSSYYSYSAPVVSNNGMIYANGAYLYPDGTPMWQSSLANSPVVHSSAIGSDGTIYYYNYYYNCLNAVYTNGGLRWSYNFDNSGSTSNPTSFSPAIGSDGTIYFGANDGNLYAFNTKNSVNVSPWPQFQQNAQHTGVQTTSPLQVFDLRYLTLQGTPNILKSLKLEMIQQSLWMTVTVPIATVTATPTTTRLPASILKEMPVDLTQLTGVNGIFNLTVKYPQQLANSGLKLYPKLIGNYEPGQTTYLLQNRG